MDDIARILLDWHVILIAGSLLVIFPLVFYISSLDKSPVKVKKIKLSAKKAARKAAKITPPEETMEERYSAPSRRLRLEEGERPETRQRSAEPTRHAPPPAGKPPLRTGQGLPKAAEKVQAKHEPASEKPGLIPAEPPEEPQEKP